MKFLLIGILSLYSLGSFANQQEWDKMPFEQQKKMMVEKLEDKSAMIQKALTCVNDAKDKAQVKACHTEMEKKQAMMNEKWKMEKQSQEMKKKSGM